MQSFTVTFKFEGRRTLLLNVKIDPEDALDWPRIGNLVMPHAEMQAGW